MNIKDQNQFEAKDYSSLLQDNNRLVIVVSEFNWHITEKLLHGAYDFLIKTGFSDDMIQVYQVPGAFEIPAVCVHLCRKKMAEGIITLGAVIRGETSHYDYVCSETARGIMNVSLNYEVPVSFGVLTCDDETQAYNRAGGKFGNKGVDAAMAVLNMMKIYQKMKKNEKSS